MLKGGPARETSFLKTWKPHVTCNKKVCNHFGTSQNGYFVFSFLSFSDGSAQVQVQLAAIKLVYLCPAWRDPCRRVIVLC